MNTSMNAESWLMPLQGNSGISSQGRNSWEKFLKTRAKQRQLLYSREKKRKIQELKFSQFHQDPRESERENVEILSKHVKDKKVISNSWYAVMKENQDWLTW